VSRILQAREKPQNVAENNTKQIKTLVEIVLRRNGSLSYG
jgi:hypothetical protein